MGKCILKFMLKPAQIDGKGVHDAYSILISSDDLSSLVHFGNIYLIIQSSKKKGRNLKCDHDIVKKKIEKE